MPLIPLGYPGKAPDRETSNAVHRMVPAGHVLFDVPVLPTLPRGPLEPDTSNEGFSDAEVEHCSNVTLVPFDPGLGAVPTVPANEAEVETTAEFCGTLAVTACREYAMFCRSVSDPAPLGK